MAYSTIIKPSDYFDTKLYTGNGTSQSITGLNFQPSWVWVKSRSNSQNNYLYDAVRGAGYQMYSDDKSGQNLDTGGVNSFNSDGFTIGSSGENANGYSQVAWNWKANGQGSSNTDGTINTTYTSASTTSGFSIVKYLGNDVSGATIGHGLGVVPKVVIVKALNSNSYDWGVYHASLGNTKNMRLNLTDGVATSTAFWNNTTPTSSVVSLGSNGTVNAGGINYVAYCFADIPGFSKMGEYAANANADGPFIYLGFKPACIILKQYNTNGSNWFLFDNKRVGFNIENYYIAPDTSGTEGTTDKLDMLSNGFKIKTSNSDVNGGDFIYMAWAETPFVANSGESIPTTAR